MHFTCWPGVEFSSEHLFPPRKKCSNAHWKLNWTEWKNQRGEKKQTVRWKQLSTLENCCVFWFRCSLYASSLFLFLFNPQKSTRPIHLIPERAEGFLGTLRSYMQNVAAVVLILKEGCKGKGTCRNKPLFFFWFTHKTETKWHSPKMGFKLETILALAGEKETLETSSPLSFRTSATQPAALCREKSTVLYCLCKCSVLQVTCHIFLYVFSSQSLLLSWKNKPTSRRPL